MRGSAFWSDMGPFLVIQMLLDLDYAVYYCLDFVVKAATRCWSTEMDTNCLVGWAIENQGQPSEGPWAWAGVEQRIDLQVGHLNRSCHFAGFGSSFPCLLVASLDAQHLASTEDLLDSLACLPFDCTVRHRLADKLHNYQLRQTIPSQRLFDVSIWFCKWKNTNYSKINKFKWKIIKSESSFMARLVSMNCNQSLYL